MAAKCWIISRRWRSTACDLALRCQCSTATNIGGFKPLFETLDKTNPHAFALPQDVQNYFEDVTARGDGSYCEEDRYEEVRKVSTVSSTRSVA